MNVLKIGESAFLHTSFKQHTYDIWARISSSDIFSLSVADMFAFTINLRVRYEERTMRPGDTHGKCS